MTNAGLINGSVALGGSGPGESLTNQRGGTITGRVVGESFIPATVTNAGAIGGGVYLNTPGGGTVINQSGRHDQSGSTGRAAVTVGNLTAFRQGPAAAR